MALAKKKVPRKKQTAANKAKKEKLRLQLKRKYQFYREIEKENDNQKKTEKRVDTDTKEINRELDKEHKRKKREEDEYTRIERERNKRRKIGERRKDEYKETERKRDQRRKMQKREDEEYRKEEREKNKSSKMQKREDEEYLKKEKERDKTRKMQKREDEEYRKEEREKDKNRKMQKREDEEYLKEEKERDKTRKMQKREDEVYRKEEREKDKSKKMQKREDEEYRREEKERDKCKKMQKREDEKYLKDEKERDKTRKMQKREDEEYRKEEREKDKSKKMQKREDEEYRREEKERDKCKKMQKREDEEYLKDEKERDKTRKMQKREDEEYRKEEREKDKSKKMQKREDEEYRREEKERDKCKKMQKREDEEYLKEEKERDKTRKMQKREDEEYRKEEREKDKSKKMQKREEEEYRLTERERDRSRKIEKRKDEQYRQCERESNRNYKRSVRDNAILKFRGQYINSLQKQIENVWAIAKLTFIEARNSLPEFVCTCCEGLFFRNSIVRFEKSKYLEEEVFSENFKQSTRCAFLDKLIGLDSDFICKTCNKAIRLGKIPKLATNNGLKFAPLPPCLKDLTDLEERMVSPYINFMQIRPLKPFSIHPQWSLKGSIVNIPVDINEMLSILPRTFDEMSVIQIKLKRHVEHKSDYMNEVIRPAHVCEALKYLITTPLYKKHNIKINKSYIKMHENLREKEIDFIIDPADNEMFQDNGEVEHQAGNEVFTLMRNLSIEEENNQESSEKGEKNCNKVEENILDLLQNMSYENELEHNSDDEIWDDEVLLLDRNKEAAANIIEVMAPGQNSKPVPWHKIEDIDELSFPRIFGGYGFDIKTKGISYSDRAKSEVRRSDRRSCIATRVLYMAKKKLELSCLASINICLRKINKTENLTASAVLDKDKIGDLIRYDAGYKVLNQVRSSPAYWENKKKQLLSMIRQLGTPTLFVTISAAEKRWPELLKLLYKLVHNKVISRKDAMELDNRQKCELIKLDPVTCARYYDYKVKRFMEYIRDKNGPFSEYIVMDSYERVEFQARGSPHEHIFLWLKGAPSFDQYDSGSTEKCLTFIDRFISCHLEDRNPYMDVQKHRHSHTCYKGRKNMRKCRFSFPKPIMPESRILEPLPETEKTKEMSENILRIKDYLKKMQKNPVPKEFQQVLDELKISEEKYIAAIRSGLTKRQIFLKRSSLEVDINNYNIDLLNLFEANMDIQFVLDPYSCASYIINYISKVDAGLTKLLREAVTDVEMGNMGIRERLRKIGSIFINSNVMSAQEAAYHIMSLPLSKSSRASVFVNTAPISERTRMMKPTNLLLALDRNSTEIFMQNIQEKYAKRRSDMEDICLADFACAFKSKSSVIDSSNDDDQDEDTNYQLAIKKRTSVLRFRRYKFAQDEVNYYREQMLLFLPWRNELEEIENINHKEKYREKLKIIETNRSKYAIIDEEQLDEAIAQVENDIRNVEEEEIEQFEKERVDKEQEIDILEQGGFIQKDNLLKRYTIPPQISLEDVCQKMRILNSKQRKIVMHVLHCFKTRKIPFNLFLSGSAGVGKTAVINLVYQTISLYFNSIPGNKADQMHVLICAPSGKAAFLIGGVTLHTAFALPVQQFGGQMPDLNADIANTIREKLFNLKLLIIDEISMVGARLISRVDTRLRQIMGIDRNFGNISVLIVGDLKQLPPVMDRYVFQSAATTKMEILVKSPLWESFEFFELTEIMRQQDDLAFAEALNNLSMGKMTQDNIKLIESRIVPECQVPDSAIRLYARNDLVESYNSERIERFPGETYNSVADDWITSRIDCEKKDKILNAIKSKRMIETGGLPYHLQLKIGIKYMITVNLDVEDGLVNGACGTLRYLSFSSPTTIEIVWLEFGEDRVGIKMRIKYENYIKKENISKNLVPIAKHSNPINMSTQSLDIIRKQFPLVAAEALTIHKSQGQTYSEICVDMRKGQRLTRNLLYVALSRVTRLQGLYIVGKFIPPNPPKDNDIVLNEINDLRLNKVLQVFSETPNKNIEFRVIYHNVRSMRKYFQDILSDVWYQTGDILVFSETKSVQIDMFYFPGYSILFRTDIDKSTRRNGGIICFSRNNVSVEVKKHILVNEVTVDYEYMGHVDLICLTYNQIDIIVGYRSPRTSNKFFEDVFDNMLSESNGAIVVMGDFNYDIYGEQNSKLISVMQKVNLYSLLEKTIPTTDFNTQIDVVFANIMETAGVYESYFSDHKPVYFSIEKQNQETIADESEALLIGLVDELTQKLKISDIKDEYDVAQKRLEWKGYNIEQDSHRLEKCPRIIGNMNKAHKYQPRIEIEELGEISNANSNYPLLDNDKKQLISPNEELSDAIINRFGEILTSFSRQDRVINENQFDHQDVLWAVMPSNIKAIQEGVAHIQILYGGQTGTIGHWICSYYDGNVVHVYDSLNFGKFVYKEHELYIRQLYPFKPPILFHQVQQQPNNTDCGLFAIAFAVSVYFKENPQNVRYDANRMRAHVWRIIQRNILEPFPQQEI